MKAELDIKPFLKATNEFGIAEPQPCGVQVVEWVGLKKKTRTRTNRCGFEIWAKHYFFLFQV